MARKPKQTPEPQQVAAMTDREKLVDLLEATTYEALGGNLVVKGFATAKEFTDHLIANGVTVQKWRDAKTDPPEEEKPVQCFFVNCQCVGFWTKEKGYKQWFASVGDLYFECEGEPDYWQHLPKPPKEE